MSLKPSVKDETTDPKVPLWLRKFIHHTCEKLNQEKDGKKPFFVITEFEVEKL